MADILRVAGLVPSIASYLPDAHCKITGLLAGQAIAAGDACYIASDGTIMRSTAVAADAAAKVRGFALIPTDAGEAVTLFNWIEIRYANAMTPGANVYLSAATGANSGRIADATSTNAPTACGFVVDAQRIVVFPTNY